MPPWFSGALQEVGRRSSQLNVGLRAKVGETVQTIRAKTQQLEENFSSSLQANYLAHEVETRLEADATRLWYVTSGTEIIQRWLALLRTAPQPRYSCSSSMPADSSSATAAEHLTFRQVFLRSRALECAIDAAARAPELRQSLREFALSPPEVWPDDAPPPVAFAQAFMMLLQTIVGPSKAWLGLLSTLLSSEAGPADEQCHIWLVRLLAGLRTGWEDAGIEEREREVESMEDFARSGLSSACCSGEVGEVTPNNVQALLANASVRGKASLTAHHAWNLRGNFADELSSAAARREALVREGKDNAATVAACAAEHAGALESQALRQSRATEELRGDLGKRACDLKEQLSASGPLEEALQRDIEQTETTQRELLRQVGQLTEKLNQLRKQKIETESRSQTFRHELQKVEGLFATKLSSEDEVQRMTQSARALSSAVVDIATGLARDDTRCSSSASSHDTSQKFTDSIACTFAADAERSRVMAAAAALELAEREVERLKIVVEAATVCADVAEERERSREAMERLGVPSTTLESDVVGEAEIAQSVNEALLELHCCRPDAEALCQALAGGSVTRSSQAATERASQLSVDIRSRLDACSAAQMRLNALMPTMEDLSPTEQFTQVSDFLAGTSPSAGSASTDATVPGPASSPSRGIRLGVAPVTNLLAAAGAQTSFSSSSSLENSGMMAMFGKLQNKFTPGERTSGTGCDDANIDPFLLVGADVQQAVFQSTVAATSASEKVRSLDTVSDCLKVPAAADMAMPDAPVASASPLADPTGPEDFSVRNLDTGEVDFVVKDLDTGKVHKLPPTVAAPQNPTGASSSSALIAASKPPPPPQ